MGDCNMDNKDLYEQFDLNLINLVLSPSLLPDCILIFLS